MGLLKSSGYFHAFSTYGPTWAFPTSLIKLQDGFYRLLRQISASLCDDTASPPLVPSSGENKGAETETLKGQVCS